MSKIISKSSVETRLAGKKLAGGLKPGAVVALIGELGAGKTIFTKGIAEGLGIKETRYVNSPTFVLIKEYQGRLPLYHFDLYRPDHASALDSIAYEEYFYGDGISVIEWADKIQELLPKGHIEVRIRVIGESRREIMIKRMAR